jgi:hypothetical protein
MARPPVPLTRPQVAALRAAGLAAATLLVAAAPLLRGAPAGLDATARPAPAGVTVDTGR